MAVNDFLHRAAEIYVDDIGAKIGVEARGFCHHLWIASGQLYGHRRIFRRTLDHLHGLSGISDHRLAGNHLGNHHRCAMTFGYLSERHVRDPG